MKLVNLVPLKEDLSRASMEELEALARQAQDIQDSEAGYAQQQGDFDIDKFGNEFADQKVMPYGGEYYSMNDIQDAIAKYHDKRGDVPYDVAIGRMTQGEYDKHMSTVAKDKAAFTKSSKFDRMNEAKIKSAEEFAATASDEQKAMAKKWDSLVTTIAFKKEDPKQHTANMEAKQEYLTNLNNAGKLKKKYSDDKIEDWSISSSLFGWKVASTVLPTPTNEGSCGHGANGVPGDTPGETKGMPADNRTRDMLRMLIQKEIKKLAEGGSLDDKLKGVFSDEEWDKITSKPVPSFADLKPKSKEKKSK